MSAVALTDLHLDESALAGPGSPNFFNGRLLTGEDLAAAQAAARAGDDELGRLRGPGVAYGLEVTLEDRGAGGVPMLRIGAGAAVTSAGTVLSLPTSVRLELRLAPPPAGAAPSAFAQCMPAAPPAAGQAQLLLLTIAPAPAAAIGRARVVGLGNEPAACAVDRLAPAVRLLLRPFAVALPPGPATRLRNHVAALLLGDTGDARASLAGEPTQPSPDGLLDQLRGSAYGADEVPLAVVHWPTAAGGVEFLDPWAARRRCHQRGGHPPLAVTEAERRAIVAEARLAQFQAHLADVLERFLVRRLSARDHFVSLPPAFVLPARFRRGFPFDLDPIRVRPLDVASRLDAVLTGGVVSRRLPVEFLGFDPALFLRGMTVRADAWVEGARVGELLAAAAQHPAVDALPDRTEALWVYPIRELAGGFRPARHVLVVSGHVRYAANAQLDLAHYDQANFAVPTT